MPESLQTYATYDHSKVIKNIECSTVYITSLQNIITNDILESEYADKIAYTFQKFEKIVDVATRKNNGDDVPEDEIKNLPRLDEFESRIYTLFSLLQELKYKAQIQGLEQKTETSATKDELREVAEMMKRGEDVTEKFKILESKLKVVK